LEIRFSGELKSVAKNEVWQFSSRPLDIASKDDFYVLESGLIVAETSLLIYDKKAYDEIDTESVPMFIRATVANYMAGHM